MSLAGFEPPVVQGKWFEVNNRYFLAMGLSAAFFQIFFEIDLCARQILWFNCINSEPI
jgi:hypothetical protein